MMTQGSEQRAWRAAAVGAWIAIAWLAVACGDGSNGTAGGEWRPPILRAYMGVPAAETRAAIAQRLADSAPPPFAGDVWTHTANLYRNFGSTLLWFDARGTEQIRVNDLLRALDSAAADAIRLDSGLVERVNASLRAVADAAPTPTAGQLAEADVLLSAAYTYFGEHMLTGQVRPGSVGQAWHIDPREERVDSALARTLRERDLGAGLARMRPQDPGYAALREQFGILRAAQARGGWDSIPPGGALGRGDGGARVQALWVRLRDEGYLSDSAPVTQPYDRALAAAVSAFQKHHGLARTGTLNRATVAAMNVPVERRLAQVAANMERYRWLPRDLGGRYILVNVPRFTLTAFDSGVPSLEMKVIVGKDYEDRATPVFSDSMELVIFRPYWNITPDIARKEILPNGREYLAAHDMEIYNDHGRVAVRQRPGPQNSLGLVKFMFPNDFNIYLHDTPNRELFHKDVRAFSHGCIRVEKPVELAEWVLGWPHDRVVDAMHGRDNRAIELPRKIPVYIVYFTALVDSGHVNYGTDLYDRDRALVQAMARAGPAE